ncbi:MAG: TldE/PmbA family protein, partial [Planctomycetota bacterium]
MKGRQPVQSYFYELADYIKEQLSPGQEYTARFSAEDSDFIRFNHGRVRQSGTVRQRSLFIDLIEGKRHVQGSLGLAGGLQEDRHRVRQLIAGLSGRLPEVAEDPHLLYSTEVRSTEARRKDRVPEPAVVLEAVSAASEGRDLVGVYAGGGIEEGFANSL